MKQMVDDGVKRNQEKQKLLIQQNKLAAMGEMIGSIAHQWRQPLNNVSLILHFIRDNAKNKDFVDNRLNNYVEKAKRQIEYMSDTIDDFKNFYKPSKNKSTFEIKKAIESAISIIHPELDKHNIEIEISASPCSIIGYENEFKQAILNIISNAKDAIMEKMKLSNNFNGKIIITISKDKLTIYNNGGNASDKVLDKMFEPYFTTKFEDKGTGIGLYMTKSIIEKSMNGNISAKNKYNGVIFTIKGLR